MTSAVRRRAPNGLPWLGSTMPLVIDPVPPTGPSAPFVLVGSQMQDIDLTPIGAPTCRLLVAPSFVALSQRVASTATWDVPLPAATALAGQTVFAQAVLFDPPASPLGIALNDGVGIVPGIR